MGDPLLKKTLLQTGLKIGLKMTLFLELQQRLFSRTHFDVKRQNGGSKPSVLPFWEKFPRLREFLPKRSLFELNGQILQNLAIFGGI